MAAQCNARKHRQSIGIDPVAAPLSFSIYHHHNEPVMILHLCRKNSLRPTNRRFVATTSSKTSAQETGVWVRPNDSGSVAVMGPDLKWHSVRRMEDCKQTDKKPRIFKVHVCDLDDLRIDTSKLADRYDNMRRWKAEEIYLTELAEKVERSFLAVTKPKKKNIDTDDVNVKQRLRALNNIGVYMNPEQRRMDKDCKRLLTFLCHEARGAMGWDEESDTETKEELERKRQMLAVKKPTLHDLAGVFFGNSEFVKLRLEKLARSLDTKGWRLRWDVEEWEINAHDMFCGSLEAQQICLGDEVYLPPETIMETGQDVNPFLYLSIFPDEEQYTKVIRQMQKQDLRGRRRDGKLYPGRDKYIF